MRITTNMLGRNLLRNLESAQGRMDELQNQLSSGLRINKPSDDPVAIESALRVKTNISRVEQWKKNASEALAYMNTTDAIMGEMSSLLSRAKELAVQGANGSLSDSDRQSVAKEVNQIIEQFQVIANSKVGSKHIFSGTLTDKPPLPGTYINDTSWEGNTEMVNYEVGNNVRLPVFVNGKELFGVGGDGIFETLKDLSQNLANGNQAGLQNNISKLDANIETVLGVRAELGARTNRMTSLMNQLESTTLNLTEDLSRLQDADIAETIVAFKNQENIYRAALSVGSKIVQPSLVDFMR